MNYNYVGIISAIIILGTSQLIQWMKYVTPRGNGHENLKHRVEKLEDKLDKADLVTIKEAIQDLYRKHDLDQKEQKDFRHTTNNRLTELIGRDFEIERLLLKKEVQSRSK